jgi:hypothetical protein
LSYLDWSAFDEFGFAIKLGRVITVVGGIVTYANVVFWITTTFIVYLNLKLLVKYSAWSMFFMSLMSVLLFVGFGMTNHENSLVWDSDHTTGSLIYTAIPAFFMYIAAGVCALVQFKDNKSEAPADSTVSATTTTAHQPCN